MSAVAAMSASELQTLLRAARRNAQSTSGSMLDVLLGLGSDARQLALALQTHAGVAVFDAAVGLVADFGRWDAAAAERHRCVALRDDGGLWHVAAEDPWNEVAVQATARALGTQPRVVAIRRAEFEALIGVAQARPSRASAAVGAADDGPVVRFVDDALAAAARAGASDVHFECDRMGIAVKHRLDGVLVRHEQIDGVLMAQEVISRIKVLAKLDITERRLPQDGRFRLPIGGVEVDVRVSVIPSVHGEDAVLRLLDKAQLRGSAVDVSLDKLGFEAGTRQHIRELAQRPSGLLLVTGPTGSGKTTTVYAALSEINTGIEKIITIEDPVEYELTGVLQVPVNERKGLTFAKGLRAILRHDPDRILVGEIRDAETASIAVQSALTGHLVFTTVHANSVSDVVGRFRHFDIDMFGFMSALNGIVVQRLLRRVCVACVRWSKPGEAELSWFVAHGHDLPQQVPLAVGCPACRGTGYRGRFVMAEVHGVDDRLRDLVTDGAALSEVKAHAGASGVQSLDAQALAHVLDGLTTVQEVRRVVG
jgi:general secretion pathway protein E